MRLLNDTAEDWLYEEGDNETKTVYNKKLEEFKKEFEGRSAALGAVVVCHDRKLTQYKAGNEELAHIPAEEMQEVEEAVHKKQQWMHEQLQKFENLPKSADTPITIAQILAEAKLLSTTCDPIVNKPKLKVESPKDETKKTETRKKMGKIMKTLANNQPQDKKIQCTTCLQMNHNRLATTLAQNIPCILTPLISTWMLTERHFMNGKLIFNSI